MAGKEGFYLGQSPEPLHIQGRALIKCICVLFIFLRGFSIFSCSFHHAVIDHIDTYEIYGTLNFSQLFLIKRLSYGAETVDLRTGKSFIK